MSVRSKTQRVLIFLFVVLFILPLLTSVFGLAASAVVDFEVLTTKTVSGKYPQSMTGTFYNVYDMVKSVEVLKNLPEGCYIGVSYRSKTVYCVFKNADGQYRIGQRILGANATASSLGVRDGYNFSSSYELREPTNMYPVFDSYVSAHAYAVSKSVSTCYISSYSSDGVEFSIIGPTGAHEGSAQSNESIFNCINGYSNNVTLYCPDGIDFLYEYVVVSGVTGVSLNRTAPQMDRGSSFPIAIDVTGFGSFDRTCYCEVSGNNSVDTYIFKDESLPYDSPNTFHLVIGTDETAEELTIVATSVQNPSVSAIHTVSLVDPVIPGETVPDTPEGEEPIPTEDNPTEPSDISGGDSGEDNEKDEAVSEGGSSVDDLTEVIPDYSEGFIQALQNFAGAMSYTGTEAKLKIPAVMFPQLGNLVPGFQMMDEVELDFEMYVGMMPDNLMTLVRALFTVALIVYCFKEFYGLIAYALTLKGGIA